MILLNAQSRNLNMVFDIELRVLRDLIYSGHRTPTALATHNQIKDLLLLDSNHNNLSFFCDITTHPFATSYPTNTVTSYSQPGNQMGETFTFPI
jgi:hypothetical protein